MDESEIGSPRDMSEFFAQGWDKQVVGRVDRYNAAFNFSSPVDDICQDIILAMIKTSYIDHFKPDTCSFKGYLFIFVDSFIRQKFLRSDRPIKSGFLLRGFSMK